MKSIQDKLRENKRYNYLKDVVVTAQNMSFLLEKDISASQAFELLVPLLNKLQELNGYIIYNPEETINGEIYIVKPLIDDLEKLLDFKNISFAGEDNPDGNCEMITYYSDSSSFYQFLTEIVMKFGIGSNFFVNLKNDDEIKTNYLGCDVLDNYLENASLVDHFELFTKPFDESKKILLKK